MGGQYYRDAIVVWGRSGRRETTEMNTLTLIRVVRVLYAQV